MMKFIKRYIFFFKKLYFSCLSDGYKRSNFLRKKNRIRKIGKNVYYYSRIYPQDANLLSIGDNVIIATNVRFVSHDRVDLLLKGMYGKKYKE